ncbi:MAG: ribosome biogenesis GTP-binding protein YihA/YsxC [Acidiferrobacterales bacterium]|nr:ribosome biogenesis GTP-binding protein YihA/YsxC [Acidiferrobacterales bacterium]
MSDFTDNAAKQSPRLPKILRNPEFLLGAAEPNQFPQDNKAEIAFLGRSNVGKSSAINAITNRRKLARTSKTPGRTQQINFFSLGEHARLADLPGYGFAQVPTAVKEKWQKTIQNYLDERLNLLVLVLLMDIRHPLTALDKQIVEWASTSQIPTQILLTKADKFKRGKLNATVLSVEKELSNIPGNFAVEPFSSLNYLGVDKMRTQIAEWIAHTNLDECIET